MEDSVMVRNMRQLEQSIASCHLCVLCKNKKSLPQWSEHVKYVMMFEQPHREEPEYMEKFWELFKKAGLSRRDFAIIHTVQCHADLSKRKGRTIMPAKEHRRSCSHWVDTFIGIIRPEKIIVFGNVAMEEICGVFSGITKDNGDVIKPKIGGYVYPTVLSVSPNFLKSGKNGEKMLKKSLDVFKNL